MQFWVKKMKFWAKKYKKMENFDGNGSTGIGSSRERETVGIPVFFPFPFLFPLASKKRETGRDSRKFPRDSRSRRSLIFIFNLIFWCRKKKKEVKTNGLTRAHTGQGSRQCKSYKKSSYNPPILSPPTHFKSLLVPILPYKGVGLGVGHFICTVWAKKANPMCPHSQRRHCASSQTFFTRHWRNP